MEMTGRIIDLSQEIYHQAPTFPWDPKCGVIVHNTIETIGFNVTQLCMSAHQGTHADAPYHFIEGGMTVDKVPLDVFVGPAKLIDVRNKKPKEPITPADFGHWAEDIGAGDRVVIMTGWDKIFPEQRYLTDFPYVSNDLADWLATRKIALLAVDFPSLSAVDGPYVHRTLLGSGAAAVEGLCNLEQIGKDEFLLLAAPLRIRGRDGAPLRAVGIVND